MCNSETGDITSPKGFKVLRETDLTTVVHLDSLSVELWKNEVWCCGWISHRNLEFKLELVFGKLVHEPTLSSPSD